MENKEHPVKKWEVTIIEIHENGDILYKVKKRVPELNVSETKIFTSKEEAKAQFEEWLS